MESQLKALVDKDDGFTFIAFPTDRSCLRFT